MRRKLLILTIICAFMLTGCTKAIELTDEQSGLVAEYAAGALVRNSYSYKSKYPDADIVRPTLPEKETTDEEATETETTSATDEPATHAQETKPDDGALEDGLANASKALGIEPVELTYKSYKIVDEYPDDPDALFTVVPEPGYRFIVVFFNLHNPSDTAVTLNTLENSTIFKATINRVSVNNFATLLLNDVTALSEVTIEAGADYEGLVLFMVNESTANEMESFKLSYKYNDVSYSVQLK